MLKIASIGGSIVVIIALVVALLKALTTLVGFIAIALQILIVLAFVFVFVSVGYMILRGWQDNRRTP